MQTTGMHGSAPTAAHEPLESTNEGLNRLSDTAHQAMDRFRQTAAQYTERFGPRVEEWMHAPAVEKTRVYMREHPMAAVGIAIAVGLILSRLLSRR